MGESWGNASPIFIPENREIQEKKEDLSCRSQ